MINEFRPWNELDERLVIVVSVLQRSLDEAEAQAQHKDIDSHEEPKASYKADRTMLGLGSYACSSVFLASMLTFAKILGKENMPVFEILLARSSSILIVSLIVCAKDRVNPFGNR